MAINNISDMRGGRKTKNMLGMNSEFSETRLKMILTNSRNKSGLVSVSMCSGLLPQNEGHMQSLQIS